jgi:hydrogenase expression/formation protein HypE
MTVIDPQELLSCPVPISQHGSVTMAHGGGGRIMHQLIEGEFLTSFSNPTIETRHDGAVLDIAGARIAFTTDSYVVHPLFFPGGDIGTLAVNGTINDLAMCGARPLFLSVGFVLEEGLPLEMLDRVVRSLQQTAQTAGVQIVTGDTKVVDRGKGDGIFVNTAGIGVVEHRLTIGPSSVLSGDAVLLSGDIGRHGIAIMAAREGLEFESTIESDCAPLSEPAIALVEAGIEVHCLRDLTRGGLASALAEIAESARVHISIDETSIAVEPDVQAACEILGFDPLYVANEGRFICIVSAADVDRSLEVLRRFGVTECASRIGQIDDEPAGAVTMTTKIGAHRIVDMLSGEQLPRIC